VDGRPARPTFSIAQKSGLPVTRDSLVDEPAIDNRFAHGMDVDEGQFDDWRAAE
jgi:hypothetical protein